MPRRADMRGWTPPKIIEHHGFDEDFGQPSLPGMPGHDRLPAGGIDKHHPLWHQDRNPNVWGNLAHADHNPFRQHSFGDSFDLHDAWEDHDGWNDKNSRDHDKMLRHVQKAVSGGTPCIAVTPHVIHSVLDDRRVKSQFETGTSNGMLNRRGRAGVEHMHFGYPDAEGRDWHASEVGHGDPDSFMHEDEDDHPADHPDHARPIYGYLARHTLANDTARMYGAHVLVLKKPHVWHRTTACIGDSLNLRAHLRPQPVQDFREHAIPLRSDSGHLNAREWDNPEADLSHRIEMHRGLHLDKSPEGYVEAQIHGGVHLNDIHYAVLRGLGGHVGDLKRHLSEAKVPWVHTHTPGHGHSIPDVIDHSSAHQAMAALHYQAKLVQAMEGAMSGRVVAQQGPDRFLIELPDGKGQIADTGDGKIWPPIAIESILARGYWEATSAIDVEDVLALVKPAV